MMIESNDETVAANHTEQPSSAGQTVDGTDSGQQTGTSSDDIAASSKDSGYVVDVGGGATVAAVDDQNDDDELEEGELSDDDDDEEAALAADTSKQSDKESRDSSNKRSDRDRDGKRSSSSRSREDNKSSSKSSKSSSSKDRRPSGGSKDKASTKKDSADKDKTTVDNRASSKNDRKRSRKSDDEATGCDGDGSDRDSSSRGGKRSRRDRSGRSSSNAADDSESDGGSGSGSDDETTPAQFMQKMMLEFTKLLKKGGKLSEQQKAMQTMMERLASSPNEVSKQEMRDMARKNGLRSSSRERDKSNRLGRGLSPTRIDRRGIGTDRRGGRNAVDRRRERDREREQRLREAREKDMERRRDPTARQLCKFFVEGKCHKGHDCPYSHDIMQLARKKEICKFYLQGYCSKGDHCLFMHGEFPCKFYHTGAECYSGDNCRFSHEPLTEDTRAILRCYLDSGELPDDHVRQQNAGIGGNNENNNGNNQDGSNTTIPYQPMKPVAKRHAVLGEVTDEMRKSYFTWVWQMEMKELELAYTGTKRNLFCIEPPNAINLDDKPATPPPDEFDDEDEQEFNQNPNVASFYIDTCGDRDERFGPPPAAAGELGGDGSQMLPDDDQHLIEAAFHDEDLRLPPDACFNLSDPSPVFGELDPASESSRLPPNSYIDSSSQEANEASALPLNNNNSSTLDDRSIATGPATALDPRLELSGEKRKGLLSDSDDDAADEPLQAALKRLDQQKAGGDGVAPQAADGSGETKKPIFDIAKLLNVIRMTSNPQSGTTTTGTASAPQSDFWQNNRQTGSGGQTGVTGVPMDPRDPRMRRAATVKQDSQDSKDGLMTKSDVGSDYYNSSGAGEPSYVEYKPGEFCEWHLRKMAPPVIDYSEYVKAFNSEDSKLKNDPRLLKFMTREPALVT